MFHDDFCIFILCYKRPENNKTFNLLENLQTNYPVYCICSKDDPTLNEYKSKFNNVLVYDKKDYLKRVDTGDNFDNKNVVVFARNAVYDLAEQIGKKYFLVLDDDYNNFNFRFDFSNNSEIVYDYISIEKNIDMVFDAFLGFYKSTKDNVKTICFAQGGDFIGGESGSFAKTVTLKRKAMNSFFCSTERRINFVGRINEDCVTYVYNSRVGEIFFTSTFVSLQQAETQQQSGGLTDFYKETGTYYKSFYSVIFSPSCARISAMGTSHLRLHHKILSNNAYPKILRPNS